MDQSRLLLARDDVGPPAGQRYHPADHPLLGAIQAVDDQFIDLPWLEARADRLRDYETLLIPGLLQTREYAETLIRNAAAADTPEEKIERMIELRMTRQQVLDGEASPSFAAVVDESVLRRIIGGPKVMRDQLTTLLDLTERPNVEIRVLPLRSGAHAGLVIVYTRAEWEAFTAGVRLGEFDLPSD